MALSLARRSQTRTQLTMPVSILLFLHSANIRTSGELENVHVVLGRPFGASEENHIIKSCYDTECDKIDIQPWYKGPYSVTTIMVATGPNTATAINPNR